MTEPSLARRRRPARQATIPTVSLGELRRLGALSVFPVALCVAHATAGANSTVAALWLAAMLAIALCLTSALPSRSARVLESRFLVLVGIPFALTLLVAAWTVYGSVEVPPGRFDLDLPVPRAPSIDRSATLLEIVKLLALACAFLVGCVQGATVKRAIITAHALVVSGAFYALLAFGPYLAGGQERAGNRFTAGLMSANSAATLFGVLLVIAASLLIRQGRRSTHGRWGSLRFAILLGCVAILGVALILTVSRMGLTATGIALMVLIARALWSRRARLSFKSDRWIWAAGVSALGLWALLEVLRARSVTLGVDANTRSTIFASHWDAFLASPTFGYGLGTFTTINDFVMTPDTYGALWSIRAAHNVYIQWLEEAGLLGALPMFATIAIGIGITALRARRSRTERTLLEGLVLCNLVVLLHGTTDYALQVPSIAAAWAFILGLQCAFSQAATIEAAPPAGMHANNILGSK